MWLANFVEKTKISTSKRILPWKQTNVFESLLAYPFIRGSDQVKNMGHFTTNQYPTMLQSKAELDGILASYLIFSSMHFVEFRKCCKQRWSTRVWQVLEFESCNAPWFRLYNQGISASSHLWVLERHIIINICLQISWDLPVWERTMPFMILVFDVKRNDIRKFPHNKDGFYSLLSPKISM